MRISRTLALSAAAAAVAATTRAAGDDEAAVRRLEERIAELQDRVAELEAGDRGQWLTQRRADEIRTLVEDVLADAEMRSSLLASGVRTGYDNGFTLASTDDNWLLRTNLLMQQRFVINSRDDDDRWGFENSRTRFILSGHAVSPEWFYRVEIDVGANGGGLPAGVPAAGLPADARTGTLDAYVGYDFGNGVQLWGGSLKAPLLREELVDSVHQQAVERSVVNYLFTAGRVDGVAVSYTGEKFRVSGAYHDGIRSRQSGFGTPDTRFAFSARGEYLFEGEWDQFHDFTSRRGEEAAILAGGGLLFQTDDDGAPDLDLVTLTVDGSFEFGGANLFAAFMYSNFDTAGGGDGDQLGLVVQGGLYFDETWEAYGRFEWADLAPAGLDDTVILTVGVNKYFNGQFLKWSTDLGVGFNEVRLAPAVAGFRPDGAGDNGQVVIRSQLQIAF